MRLRTDALRDSMRAPMPTMAQKDAERKLLKAQIAEFEASGKAVTAVRAGASANPYAAKQPGDTGFMGAGFTATKAASARGGKC